MAGPEDRNYPFIDYETPRLMGIAGKQYRVAHQPQNPMGRPHRSRRDNPTSDTTGQQAVGRSRPARPHASRKLVIAAFRRIIRSPASWGRSPARKSQYVTT